MAAKLTLACAVWGAAAALGSALHEQAPSCLAGDKALKRTYSGSRLVQKTVRQQHGVEANYQEEESEDDDGGADPWSVTLIIDSKYVEVFKCWWAAYLRGVSRAHVRVAALDDLAVSALVELQRGEPAGSKPPAKHADLAVSIVHPATSAVQGPYEDRFEILDLAPPPRPSLLQVEVGLSPASFLQTFWPTMRESIALSPGGTIHSDADALWVRNPGPMLKRLLRDHPDADIVSEVSFGATWDPAFEAWGFVLNTGFVLFRRTEGVLNMVDSFAATNQTRLEQGILNRHLLSLGCQWSRPVTRATRAPAVGRCGHLNVVALPLSEVSRAWNTAVAPKVFHPDLHRVPLAELRSQGFC